MLANDVINLELRRLITLTGSLSAQVLDLTARLEVLEKLAAGPSASAAGPDELIELT